jgi:ABC-type uncharacterized transport system permease subunit
MTPELIALFISTTLTAAIPIAMPLLYAALGEAVAEKAGILNIGLEGIMLIGAWAAYLGAVYTHSLVLGLLIGAAAGLVLGLLLAIFYVTLGTDQIVTGILVNLLVLGLTSVTFAHLFSTDRPRLANPPVIAVPILADIPGLGAILFRHDWLVYIGLLLVPATYWLMKHTWFGLDVRAVGEHPQAAETAGVSVVRVRYAAMAFVGILGALGGATLAMDSIGGFVENATAGRGFIALAVVVLGKWNPFGIFLGALVVGGTDALQLRLQAGGLPIPHELLLMLPYLLTIVVLVGFVGGARYPAAAGVAYRREA